jgi:hypothetical protein
VSRRERTRGAGLMVVAAASGAMFVLVGCGSTKTVTQTNTVFHTTTVTHTVVRHAAALPARTTTVTKTIRTPAPASSGTAGSTGGLSWSGNGDESIGTIQVPVNSVIKWTNDGGLFQILDQETPSRLTRRARVDSRRSPRARTTAFKSMRLETGRLTSSLPARHRYACLTRMTRPWASYSLVCASHMRLLPSARSASSSARWVPG